MLLAAALAVTVYDFVTHPRDLHEAVLFACGGLFGWALDHGRKR